MTTCYTGICVLLCIMVGINDSARILGIFPTPSISHQLPFQAIMKALAERGHQITVISPDPLKKPVPNYTDIDVSFSYKTFRSAFDFAKMDQTTMFDMMSQAIPVITKITDDQLSSPQVKDFIKRTNNDSFDLVFLEALMYQSYYGLIHHLGSPPWIGVLSLACVWSTGDSIGVPSNPSYIPDVMLSYGDHMTFYERLTNSLSWLWSRYKTYSDQIPRQENLMRKHFGSAIPSIFEVQKNMSLLMVGTDWLFSYPAPLPPAVVTFHSLHVKTKPDTLPEDLQRYLDEASEGVIYFSLGSNVFSSNMPLEKRNMFIEAFSELPQKVLWKWESDTLPGKPPNVRVQKWLPQQDILAHPNVKLFISQCGLQSLQEAVYHGVPILGIPFFGDQKYNAKKIGTMGIGIQLTFRNITKDIIVNTIKEMLHNSSFRENANKISTLSRDHPDSSIERTVWWTEYVLRHKGAQHLRTAAVDLEWYQYLLLDVAAFILISGLIIISISFYLFIKLFSYFGISKLKLKSE